MPVSIENVYLSPQEVRILRRFQKSGPAFMEKYRSDEVVQRLISRGMLQRCNSDQFPYNADGLMVYNAIAISDAGLQYLNRKRSTDRDNRITRTLAILALIISGLSLFLQFIRG